MTRLVISLEFRDMTVYGILSTGMLVCGVLYIAYLVVKCKKADENER